MNCMLIEPIEHIGTNIDINHGECTTKQKIDYFQNLQTINQQKTLLNTIITKKHPRNQDTIKKSKHKLEILLTPIDLLSRADQ